MTTMTESDWEETFLPFNHPGDDGRRHFEDDDGDEAFLKLIPDCHVWTQVTRDMPDGGYSITYVPGRGPGDGPIVTLRPWTEDQRDLVIAVDTDDPGLEED